MGVLMLSLFKNIERCVDSYGLIAQKPESGADGGDTANREGYLFLLLRAFGYRVDVTRNDIPIELSIAATSSQLIDDKGRGRRHANEGKWYGDWDRMSRDQYIAFIIGVLANKEYKIALKMIKHHFFGTFRYGRLIIPRMGLFMTNTKKNFVYKTLEEHQAKSTPDVPHNYADKLPDITGPEMLAVYIRGFRVVFDLWTAIFVLIYLFSDSVNFLYVGLLPIAILTLGDLETLIGSIIKVTLYKGNDDGNHIAVLAHNKINETISPIALLARYIYFKYRDYNKALDGYFAPNHGHAPFGELFKEAIKKGKI
jgi:hypothetical protein